MTVDERITKAGKIVSEALSEAQNLTNSVFMDHLLLEITKHRIQDLFDLYCEAKLENLNFIICDSIKLIEKISKELAIAAINIFNKEEIKNG